MNYKKYVGVQSILNENLSPSQSSITRKNNTRTTGATYDLSRSTGQVGVFHQILALKLTCGA